MFFIWCSITLMYKCILILALKQTAGNKRVQPRWQPCLSIMLELEPCYFLLVLAMVLLFLPLVYECICVCACMNVQGHMAFLPSGCP